MLYLLIVGSWLAAVVLGWRCGAAWQKYRDRREAHEAWIDASGLDEIAYAHWAWPEPPLPPHE